MDISLCLGGVSGEEPIYPRKIRASATTSPQQQGEISKSSTGGGVGCWQRMWKILSSWWIR